ncbi:hypothetical protein GGS24DRAFT_215598 [Hypoxylon argillaceum]|nr:hypothetical protein GGS24DRAFT_215598 [Hypoxylon argillaceum]
MAFYLPFPSVSTPFLQPLFTHAPTADCFKVYPYARYTRLLGVRGRQVTTPTSRYCVQGRRVTSQSSCSVKIYLPQFDSDQVLRLLLGSSCHHPFSSSFPPSHYTTYPVFFVFFFVFFCSRWACLAASCYCIQIIQAHTDPRASGPIPLASELHSTRLLPPAAVEPANVSCQSTRMPRCSRRELTYPSALSFNRGWGG